MTMPFSRDTIVARRSDILEAEVDAEIVALDVEAGNCYGFNKVGSRIWNILAEPGSVGDIVSRLTAVYDVDAQTCEQQVLELLEELRGQGLVRVAPTAAP